MNIMTTEQGKTESDRVLHGIPTVLDYANLEREVEMADINSYKDSSELTWMFVKKWGKVYVAPKEKQSWVHDFSTEPRKYWKYIPELNVWRSNVSAL